MNFQFWSFKRRKPPPLTLAFQSAYSQLNKLEQVWTIVSKTSLDCDFLLFDMLLEISNMVAEKINDPIIKNGFSMTQHIFLPGVGQIPLSKAHRLITCKLLTIAHQTGNKEDVNIILSSSYLSVPK